jgi:sigma-B regulation protein RsbU (phosphoserine phosphatase)
MDTAYNINNQTWLRQAIDSGYAIWTAPYFDTGGGNILMKTRAVPVIVNGKTIAVATTDLAL